MGSAGKRPARESASSIAEGNKGYMSGFGNGFESKALPGALPVGRNSPQKCPYGPYAEQLSGSPFTVPRVSNKRSWLYRIRPTVKQSTGVGSRRSTPAFGTQRRTLGLRCQSSHYAGLRFLCRRKSSRSLKAFGRSRRPAMVGRRPAWRRIVYLVTRSMKDEYFYNADGEMMIVPQEGRLRLATEFGIVDIAPCEIAVIPPSFRKCHLGFT